MSFRLLQNRLIEHLKARIRNGELTERSLARLSGISQPHLHNALKGVKLLSPALTDQLLASLHLDFAALLRADPRGHEPEVLRERLLYGIVRVLDGWVGPGHPYPDSEKGSHKYPFLATELNRLASPVAVRLARDPRMQHLFEHGAIALLDRSEQRREFPNSKSYYAVDLDGESAIRMVRCDQQRIYLFNRDPGPDVQEWESLPLAGHSLPQLVKGRVSLIVRRL